MKRNQIQGFCVNIQANSNSFPDNSHMTHPKIVIKMTSFHSYRFIWSFHLNSFHLCSFHSYCFKFRVFVSIFRLVQTRLRTLPENRIVSFVSFHLCLFYSYCSKFRVFVSMFKQIQIRLWAPFENVSSHSYRFKPFVSFHSNLCQKLQTRFATPHPIFSADQDFLPSLDFERA